MATKTRIEFGNLQEDDYANPNLMNGMPVSAVAMTVTGTASSTGTTVPAGVRFAFITAIDGNVIALPGTAPTAIQTTGKLCIQGVETPISVQPGQLISLIELA